MSLRSLLLAAMAATAAGQSSRKRPVVMPFGLEYGEHVFGAWYGIPVTVGEQQFDLSISTSLSQSWVPGKELCASETNVTACTVKIGGVFDTSTSSSWKADASQTGVKISDGLLKGFYNSSIATSLEVGSDKKILGMEGVGDVGTDTITLKSDTGTFKMETQAVGIIKEGDKEYIPNGYLSLQQMALSLYSNGFTPSPTFHLFQGFAAYSNDTILYLDSLGSQDWGGYLLIFGGYDSAVLNLNTTQQYPLIETQFTATSSSAAAAPTASDTPLPASESVSYGMQVMLDDIVYRWSEGGKTDNSLLPTPHLAIIDSSTPWIWLPKTIHDSLVTITGSVWNETYGSYTIPYCGFYTCDSAQGRAMDALLDFKFESMDGDELTLSFFNYMMVKYLPQDDYSVYLVPIKSLPEDAPIILGRPFLAGIHLWVDYAEKYWGMAQGNVTEQNQLASNVVGWDRYDHAPITNTSILVERLTTTDGTGSSSSGSGGSGGSGSSATKDKGMGIGVIAGIAGGGVVVVGALVMGCCFYHRRKRNVGKDNRPESSHELRPTDIPKISELPHDGQLRPYELPQNQSQFSKPHELPQSESAYNKPQELPPSQSSYYKPQQVPQSPGHFPQAELPSNSGYYKPPVGQYQAPPPPPGHLPQQQGYYSPITPPGHVYQYPPQPQHGVYSPPPTYDIGQGGPGGPVYYEMDGGAGSYQAR